MVIELFFYQRYTEIYGLKEPTDDILELLLHIDKTKNKTKLQRGFDNSVKKVYDIDSVGMYMFDISFLIVI